MNVKALQWADHWLGVPLCFVLTAARRLAGHRAPDCSRPPRSLLFVKLAEQGSNILAYPALRRAVEIVGRENVYFVVLEDNRFILDAMGALPENNIFTVPTAGPAAFFRGLVSVIRRLRRLRLDATVDLEFFSRGSAALAFLSGAARRVGFHPFFGAGLYRGDLLTHRLLYNPYLHTSQTFLTLVEASLRDPAPLPTFDLPAPPATAEPPPFVPSEDELAEVRAILRRSAAHSAPLILLNANTSDLLPLRRWPAERYVELARRLLDQHPEILVAFTGAPDEAAAAANLARQVATSRCVSLAGQTTLRQLLVLYSLAEVLVTNDSGPAHFATLTPIHVVTLFGPETPALFAARSPRHSVLWAGLACSPCVNAYNNRQSPCRDNRCMQAITTDQVLALVDQIYRRRRQLKQAAPAG
jgi:ADP-heptose:LPS heptosyltransferase